MPEALDPQATFDYVLKEDRSLPEDHPARTVFLLRGLTMKQDIKVANSLLGGRLGSTELSVTTGTQAETILQAGLAGWRNFNKVLDRSGDHYSEWKIEAIPFGRQRGANGAIMDGLLDYLSSDARAELANAITSRGKVSDEEGN